MNAVRKLSNESSFMRNVKSGHIVLHRSVNNDDWANCAVSFALWAKLLCMASYKDRVNNFDGKSWELKTGQLVTTYAILGRMVQVAGKPSDKELIRNIIRKFKASGKITTEKSGNSVIITVLNYAQYQSDFFTAPVTVPNTAVATAPDTAEECNNDNGLNGEESAPVTAPNTAVATAPDTAQNNTLLNNTLVNNKNNMSSGDDLKVKNNKNSIDFIGIMQAYRDVALDELPLPEELNQKRKTAIKKLSKLLVSPDVETFKNYFQRFMDLISGKPFYRGGNSGNEWKATFDYVLREDTLIKTREGSL